MQLLYSILSQKRYCVAVFIVFLIYFFIYLAATQFLIFTSRMGSAESFFAFKVLPNWQDLIFRQRSPFLFEPIALLYLGPTIKLFISIPNIIIAFILGILVAVNVALSYYSFRALALRGLTGAATLLGTIPAIVSGAACCVPTLILVIGLQLTATLVTVLSFFVPLSIILLFISLWWSVHKIAAQKL